MSTALRHSSPGKTRTCPHCRATILESANVCPACGGHLKFGAGNKALTDTAVSFFEVEGRIDHPAGQPPWEYSVVVSIEDDNGAVIQRQVIGVGALSGSQGRHIRLSVNVDGPGASHASNSKDSDDPISP